MNRTQLALELTRIALQGVEVGTVVGGDGFRQGPTLRMRAEIVLSTFVQAWGSLNGLPSEILEANGIVIGQHEKPEV